MSARIIGVVVETQSDHAWSIGTIRVTQTCVWHNQILPLASLNESIVHVPGLKLTFHVAEIEGKGPVAIGAMLYEPPAPREYPAIKPPTIITTGTDSNDARRSELYQLCERALMLFPNRTDGDGGTRHRFIQQAILDIAHSLNYRAIIEYQVPNGSVDVAIHTSTKTIACEVSITTKHREWRNIKKCLEAGFDYVVSIALDTRTLEIVKRGVLKNLPSIDLSRVKFLLPEDLDAWLIDIKKQESISQVETSMVRGWKVRKTVRSLPLEDIAKRRSVIAEVLARSFNAEVAQKPRS